MPHLEFFIVAQEISIDQSTNQASVFSILEEIQTANFPIIFQKIAVLSTWRAEAGDRERDWQVILRVIQPNGEHSDFTSNFRFTGSPRHRVVQRFIGLPINMEGDLRFELLLNGEHAAEHIVFVQRVASTDIQ
jgi:hypothetical protein